ncbi:ABC transporter substrate-binding protein [Geminicoccaceae bacterium 1502E]|nr:ABC transporter substrate-binding protein [Geminicoccaceae bacterium 1502E]
MQLTRRVCLAAGLAALTWPRHQLRAGAGAIRVGVLKFGTVSWELDVIKHHELDRKAGFELLVRPFAGNEAADVALMGGAVDAIVEDWLWVSRQRSLGAPMSFIPYSSSVGALMVAPASPLESLADLAGRRIGVAGGAIDKSWLMVRALARERHGLDLATDAEPVFAAPPLLSEKLRSGELDAALNYWHFCARLEAEGYRRLLGVGEAQEALGVPATVPQLGYVFEEGWGRENAALIAAFAAASREAKAIMRTSEAEWERLEPLTRAGDAATREAFRRRFAEGIVERWGDAERAQAARLYEILADLGGGRLVGEARRLAPGTFWEDVRF